MSHEEPDLEPEHDRVDRDLGGSGLAAEKAKRLDKIAALRDAGTNPYPYRFDRTHTLDELRAQFGDAGARRSRPSSGSLSPGG